MVNVQYSKLTKSKNIKKLVFSVLSVCELKGFSEVFEDEGDFTGCEVLGLGWHPAFAEGIPEGTASTNPTIEVAHGSCSGEGIGEVEHG